MSESLIVVTGAGGFIGGVTLFDMYPSQPKDSKAVDFPPRTGGINSGPRAEDNLVLDLRNGEASTALSPTRSLCTTLLPIWAGWASSKPTRRFA